MPLCAQPLRKGIRALLGTALRGMAPYGSAESRQRLDVPMGHGSKRRSRGLTGVFVCAKVERRCQTNALTRRVLPGTAASSAARLGRNQCQRASVSHLSQSRAAQRLNANPRPEALRRERHAALASLGVQYHKHPYRQMMRLLRVYCASVMRPIAVRRSSRRCAWRRSCGRW